jgi:hypothetical protein
MNWSKIFGHFDLNIRFREQLCKRNYRKSIISEHSYNQNGYMRNDVYLFWIDYQWFEVFYEDIKINKICDIIDENGKCQQSYDDSLCRRLKISQKATNCSI